MANLEEEKLKAEIEKLKLETKILSRPAYLKPSSWVPLVSVLIALGGAVSQWIDTHDKLVVERSINESNQNYTEGLNKQMEDIKSGLTNQLVMKTETENKALETPVLQADKAIHEIIKNKLVYIQFKGSITRETITALQKAFNDEGIPAPRPQRIDAEFDNSVRYFHDSDFDLALIASQKTEAFFRNKNCPIVVAPVKINNFEKKVPEGQIEIWINNNCND